MYTLMICMIIGLIVSVVQIILDWNIASSGSKRSVLDKIWLCIYKPVLFLFLSLSIGCMISLFIGQFPEKKRICVGYTSLVALKDGSSLSGSFFLGSGTVENKQYYFYYYEISSGGYRQDKIENTSEVTIFERNGETPKIRYYKYEFVNKTWDKWSIPSECNDISIIVPPNSITRKFDLNLN